MISSLTGIEKLALGLASELRLPITYKLLHYHAELGDGGCCLVLDILQKAAFTP